MSFSPIRPFMLSALELLDSSRSLAREREDYRLLRRYRFTDRARASSLDRIGKIRRSIALHRLLVILLV